jgi:hypothetical protein
VLRCTLQAAGLTSLLHLPDCSDGGSMCLDAAEQTSNLQQRNRTSSAGWVWRPPPRPALCSKWVSARKSAAASCSSEAGEGRKQGRQSAGTVRPRKCNSAILPAGKEATVETYVRVMRPSLPVTFVMLGARRSADRPSHKVIQCMAPCRKDQVARR